MYVTELDVERTSSMPKSALYYFFGGTKKGVKLFFKIFVYQWENLKCVHSVINKGKYA